MVSVMQALRIGFFMFLLTGICEAQVMQTNHAESVFYPDIAREGIRLGTSVALHGDYLAVAAGRETSDEIVNEVLVFDANSQQQLYQLYPDNSKPYQPYGVSLAMNEDILAVGASYTDSLEVERSGVVFLYDITTGIRIARVTANDPQSNSGFGRSLDIHDGMLYVGADFATHENVRSGAVYVFSLETLEQQAKIVPGNAALASHFGVSVAAGSEYLLVGDWGYSDGKNGRIGAAFAFDVKTYSQQHVFMLDTPMHLDGFGLHVAVTGSYGAVSGRGTRAGSVADRVYIYDLSSGELVNQFIPDSDDPNRSSIISLDAHDNLIAAGVPSDEQTISREGVVYLLRASDGVQVAKIASDVSSVGRHLGASVAIQGGWVAAGATLDGSLAEDGGAAHIFRAVDPMLVADFQEDDCIDDLDLSLVIAFWGTPLGDANFDGTTDEADLAILLTTWGFGCE